jgi:hypothetical protein
MITMIRNLKTFGVAFAAVFAATAVAASAAQAQHPAHFATDASAKTITVTEHPQEGAQVFTTAVGSVSCEEFMGTGVPEGEVENEKRTFTDLTLEEISYSGNCELAGNEASVDFDGCHYTLENPTWDTEAEDATSDVRLEGPEGCAVTIDVPVTGCEVVVPGGQTFEDALTYTNVETDEVEELTIHANVENDIDYTVKCPGFEQEFEGGSYEGTLTATAYSDHNAQNKVDLTGTATP